MSNKPTTAPPLSAEIEVIRQAVAEGDRVLFDVSEVETLLTALAASQQRVAKLESQAVPVDDERVKAIEARLPKLEQIIYAPFENSEDRELVLKTPTDIRYLLSLLAARPDVEKEDA